MTSGTLRDVRLYVASLFLIASCSEPISATTTTIGIIDPARQGAALASNFGPAVYHGHDAMFEANASVTSDAITGGVVQDTCTYSLGTTVLTPPTGPATVGVSVFATAGCAWTAISNAAWLSATGSGTGDGHFVVSWTTNDTGAPRVGVVTVGTATLTVTQQGPSTMPTNLSVLAVNGNRVWLGWTEPEAGPPTQYLLEGGVWPNQALVSVTTGNPSTLFIFDAPTGVFYVRVAALYGSARSENANEIRLVVNVREQPSGPLYLLGMVNGSSLALSWRNTSYGGSQTGVRLDVSGPISASVLLPLSESFAVSGVPDGTYTFNIAAVGAAGTSPLANPVTLTFPAPCTGVPEAPSNLSFFRVGSQVNLAWYPPATGPALTEYLLDVSGSFTGVFHTPSRLLTVNAPAGSYTIAVAGVNACGVGPETAPVTVVVP